MILKIIAGVIASIGLLYIGGWMPVLGESLLINHNYIVNEGGFLFKFNGAYYGGAITERFFYSPTVSWAILICAGGWFLPFGFFIPASYED